MATSVHSYVWNAVTANPFHTLMFQLAKSFTGDCEHSDA